MRATAFTLIELLVVISIIALLIAILLPTLGTARDEARRVKCIGQVQQIMTASHNYAADFRGWFPHRGGGAAWAWAMDGQTDLHDSFIEPYFGDRRDVMFCPSRLIEVRSPSSPQYSSQYANRFVTYQYFNYQAGNWQFPRPDLTRTDSADPRLSLWGCLAVIKNNGQNLAHDLVGENRDPDGLSAGRVDGSARWVGFDDTEMYHSTGGVRSYWPARP